ncbi:hypothetical protein [Thiomicrorhabdus sp.]|uniref:hypothetical protein n=1 Tax=Thiomicrorhabdus sp. TaxID=2039724 RepID=UPI002AA67832|nr:hypothetical protein [Thiomicrorhabdus sp.]
MFRIIESQQFLQKKDVIIGSVIAMIMASVFIYVGGTALLATFIPALIVAWLVFVSMYLKSMPLPKGTTFVPLFMMAISWQFLHFTEEFSNHFSDLFPVLYGAPAFTHVKFISINMISYFLFTIATVLVFTKGLRFLFVPVLFFVMGGALGNAIWHTWWVIWFKGYFPGFYTAQIYWIISFILISAIVKSNKATVGIMVLLMLLLVPSLTYLASPDGIIAVKQQIINHW